MTDEQRKAATRIAKCLALAQSSNPNEAAAAVRQAKALMQKYHLAETDIANSKVSENDVVFDRLHLPQYTLLLAQATAFAFHARIMIFTAKDKTNRQKARIKFIALGPSAELAAYTFSVLSRRMAGDRKKYVATLTRCQRATKIRRGDLFSLAWANHIKKVIKEFSGNGGDINLLEDYLSSNYSKAGTYEPIKPKASKFGDHTAWYAGADAAGNVKLQRPVSHKASAIQALLTRSPAATTG